MVRAALDPAWHCVLANDIDPMKCDVYQQNWGAAGLIRGDIATLDSRVLHQPVDLYWASSPCQDFSLAGKGLGLKGARSGVFSAWTDVLENACAGGYAPRLIAFENVVGLLTRNNGADFAAVVKKLSGLGYTIGALEIDAARFLPQSRPRLFVIGLRHDIPTATLRSPSPDGVFHSARLKKFVQNAPKVISKNWAWWNHDAPPKTNLGIDQIIDQAPDTAWLTKPKINVLLRMMSRPSLQRMEQARQAGFPQIGMLYKRGRPGPDGVVRQRAEIRFDGLAGCLRTPSGGSSRQTVMFVDGKETRARLLSSREVARLMGLRDDYRMPARYNQAYQVAGDGVAVPIVRYLDQQVFQPALEVLHRRNVA